MLDLGKRTFIILAIFQITSGIEIFSSDRVLITRNSRFRPLIIKGYDQLIYASFPGYPEPRIRFEYEKISTNVCEIPFDTIHETVDSISADSLARGKVVLSVLGVREYFHYVRTFIVDLGNCTFHSTMIMLNSSEVNAWDLRQLVAIVTGEREFDAFLSNHLECNEDKACRLRYNDKGELANVTEFDRPENATSWFINSVNEKDLLTGYFYTVFMANETIIKRLDKNLQVEQEIHLDKTFLYSDIYGSVNRCHGITDRKLECQLINKDFQNHAVALIDARQYKNFMRNLKLFNLADGSALVVLVLQVYTEPTDIPTFSTYLHRVDLNGRVSGPIKFQEDICKDFKDIVITKFPNSLYCISVCCRRMIRTKCVTF